MDSTKLLKGQRVLTPDGPGTVDGLGYPTGANQKPTSIWVWLDGAPNGDNPYLRGFGLAQADEQFELEPGQEPASPLEIAASQLVTQARIMAGWNNGGTWYVQNLTKVEQEAPDQVLMNNLAEALDQPPVWSFKTYDQAEAEEDADV